MMAELVVLLDLGAAIFAKELRVKFIHDYFPEQPEQDGVFDEDEPELSLT
jgi:hypothetical protein